MRGTIALAGAALALLTPALAGATANYVYHEQTTNLTGGTCGNYLDTPAPGPTDAYGLRYKIEYQFFTDTLALYYTTDGSTPAGSYGAPASGSTLVVSPTYACTFTGTGATVVDVAQATIPAQPAGTTVMYIVSAWHTPVDGGGGPEVFANSGTCGGCTPCETSSCANVFTYIVSTPATDAGPDAVADAVADAQPEATTDATPPADAAPDAGTDAALDALADAVADAGPDAVADAVSDAVADAPSDAGPSLEAGKDATDDTNPPIDSSAPDGAVVDTGTPGQDATMMADAGEDSSIGASPDASSGDAGGSGLAPLPGSDSGCGCAMPGAPIDITGGAVGLYALLALVARTRARRRR